MRDKPKYPKPADHYPLTEIIGGILLMVEIIIFAVGWPLWEAMING